MSLNSEAASHVDHPRTYMSKNQALGRRKDINNGQNVPTGACHKPRLLPTCASPSSMVASPLERWSVDVRNLDLYRMSYARDQRDRLER